MISYKKDVLERQSLAEVKMGRGSPICERVRKRLWNTLKTTFLNVKLQRLCKYHHLQCIISSKDSEKLEKSFFSLNFVGFPWSSAIRRHCITHLHDSVIDITKRAQKNFQKPLQMPNKAISRKKESICEQVQKRHCVLWAKAHLKFQSGKVFHRQSSQNLTFFLETTDAVSSGLKRRETSSVKKKLASLMVWGCISAYCMPACLFLKAL